MVAIPNAMNAANLPPANLLSTPILPGVDLSHMRTEVFTRCAAILKLRKTSIAEFARDKGIPNDINAAFLYDHQAAPSTTNHSLFTYCNIILAKPEDIRTLNGDWALHLRHIVNALASFNTYLLHTNHLTDEQLYTFLFDEVCNDPIPLIPPTNYCTEFVDLSARNVPNAADTDVSDRDSTLPHPTSSPYATE